MTEDDDSLPPMANCTECKQGYARHVLDDKGVCPRCKLERVEIRPNPIFENTANTYKKDMARLFKPGFFG